LVFRVWKFPSVIGYHTGFEHVSMLSQVA
jgi:hypothetical protein